MDRETIERRIAESEKTMEICKLCGNERGYNMAAARINSLRKQLSDDESEVIEEWPEEAGKESKEQMIGYCKFCGQSIMVEADPSADSAELNELATDRCRCDGAAYYAWKKSTINVYRQDLEVVFGEDEDMKDLFTKAGRMIMDGRIKTISVKQSEEKTLGLKMKGNGLCITSTTKSKRENISYA